MYTLELLVLSELKAFQNITHYAMLTGINKSTMKLQREQFLEIIIIQLENTYRSVFLCFADRASHYSPSN